MKYKNLKLIIIASFLVAIICVGIYVTLQTLKYDNKQPISKIYDKRYLEDDIYKLENIVPFSNIYVGYHSWEFILRYKPEVIRKSPVGYYAVLLHEDNSFCFVFWNFENKIHSIYRTRGFVSSDEFESAILLGETTFNEMKEHSFDFFVFTSSKKITTAHLCTDGIVVVKYDEYLLANSLEFYSNEELIEKKNDSINEVPYILPDDKIYLSTNQGTVL